MTNAEREMGDVDYRTPAPTADHIDQMRLDAYTDGFHNGMKNRIAKEERWAWLTKSIALPLHIAKWTGGVAVCGTAVWGAAAGAYWIGNAVGGEGCGTAACVIVSGSVFIGIIGGVTSWSIK